MFHACEVKCSYTNYTVLQGERGLIYHPVRTQDREMPSSFDLFVDNQVVHFTGKKLMFGRQSLHIYWVKLKSSFFGSLVMHKDFTTPF